MAGVCLKRRNKQQKEILDASVAHSFLQARELMQNLICMFIDSCI